MKNLVGSHMRAGRTPPPPKILPPKIPVFALVIGHLFSGETPRTPFDQIYVI